MKHISHCEFSWSWSLDPREDNSSNMRLWEIFVPAHFLTPAGSFEMPTKAEKSADTGEEADEGVVLCQIYFIATQ